MGKLQGRKWRFLQEIFKSLNIQSEMPEKKKQQTSNALKNTRSKLHKSPIESRILDYIPCPCKIPIQNYDSVYKPMF